jgi:hypothetical protein
MACPHVSGAGALLMADGASNSEVRTALQDSAEDIALSESESGSGLLDAEAAVGDLPTSPDLASIDTTGAGSASFSGSNGDYTIDAAGADVWSSDDEYGSLYKQDVSGDIVAEVTVESQEETHDWAKSGIMLANDITASGSSAGDVAVAVTPGFGFAFQWDGNGNGFMDTYTGAGSASYPCTLRIVKSGSDFKSEYSTDGGSSWATIGSATIQEASDVQDIGVFTTSHESGTNCTAEFSNFNIGSPSVDLFSVDTTRAGDASFSGSNGDYTIDAAGADVWSSDDEYGSLYKQDVSGDIVAEVTVESQEETHDWAKSGIMLANDITASGSSAGDVAVAVTPGFGFAFQWDGNGNGFMDTYTGAGSASYPCTLRIVKSGSDFKSEYSTDGGSSWATIGSATIQEASDVQDIGVFTTSHESGTNCTAEFTDFGIN